jgi:hypothetical protein
VEWRDGFRRGVGRCPAPGMSSRLARQETTLRSRCIHIILTESAEPPET